MSNTPFTRRAMLGAAAGLAAASAARPAFAQAQLLKASHSAAPDEPYQKAYEDLHRRLGVITNNRVGLQIFPNNQLGQERDVTEQLLLGSVDIACPANAVVTNFVPRLVLFDMPFLFRDRAHLNKVVEGPVGEAMAEAARERGFRVLGWFEAGVRHIMTRSRPVNTLADLRGLKIRTIPNPAHVAAFQAMGANPTPLAYGELYGALQAGVVDGAEAANTNYAAQRFYEVAPNWAMVGWTVLISPLLMSERRFQALPAAERPQWLEAGKLAARFQRAEYAAGEEERLAIAVRAGARPTQPDTAPFRESVRPVYDRFITNAGDKRLLQQIFDTV